MDTDAADGRSNWRRPRRRDRCYELCAGAGQIGLAAAVLVNRDLVQVEADPVAAAFAARNATRAGRGDRVEVRTAPMETAMRADELFAVRTGALNHAVSVPRSRDVHTSGRPRLPDREPGYATVETARVGRQCVGGKAGSGERQGRVKRQAGIGRLGSECGAAVLAGAATGSRTFTGLAALTHATVATASGQPDRALRNGWIRGLVGAIAAQELVLDKLPKTPSRLEPVALAARAVAAAAAGAIVARRAPHTALPCGPGREPSATAEMIVCVGVASATAVGSSFLGASWRSWAARRFGSDYLGAVLEDVAAITLACAGARLAARRSGQTGEQRAGVGSARHR